MASELRFFGQVLQELQDREGIINGNTQAENLPTPQPPPDSKGKGALRKQLRRRVLQKQPELQELLLKSGMME